MDVRNDHLQVEVGREDKELLVNLGRLCPEQGGKERLQFSQDLLSGNELWQKAESKCPKKQGDSVKNPQVLRKTDKVMRGRVQEICVSIRKQ